ncbi:5'-methylthioadenosine/S-adenosylhomocysteine nucleosidase family protein [Thermotalea metallivorans]|uniref:Futalosine hydrolase n=1 Tax=Thermotalea metallivorans TaxID=520762 RepID=A0A140L0X8_9FIRM|nr:hypothetical protein [Thermotalea metallivorans]KXG74203.1 hypothetical protein AN619_25210 [Thermotalea metallivorans]
MIYITTAMYWEASPFIRYLGLKRDPEIVKFQVFKNENITLIITGTGIAAAIATAHLLTLSNAQSADLLINLGICGANTRKFSKGSPVLCHKIIEHTTKKSFFPDVLFSHPFQEGILETFPRVVNRYKDKDIEGELADMEGAGVFQAASLFLPPHQIHIIKIVSDFLEGEGLTGDDATAMVERNAAQIISWIDKRGKALSAPKPVLTEEEEELLQKISKNLNLTAAMQHQLRQMAKQYQVRCGNVRDVLQSYISISSTTKNEGKMHFARIKEQLTDL